MILCGSLYTGPSPEEGDSEAKQQCMPTSWGGGVSTGATGMAGVKVQGRRAGGSGQAQAAFPAACTNLVAWVWAVLGEAFSWPCLWAVCELTGGLSEPGSWRAGRCMELE